MKHASVRVGILGKNGEIAETFDSEAEAAEELGCSTTAIRRAINLSYAVHGLHLVRIKDKENTL